MVRKKNKDKFTIFIDKSLRDTYKQWCEQEGYIASRRIELFLERELKRAIEEGTLTPEPKPTDSTEQLSAVLEARSSEDSVGSKSVVEPKPTAGAKSTADAKSAVESKKSGSKKEEENNKNVDDEDKAE